MRTWFISFAGEGRGGNLGVVCTRALTDKAALDWANYLGLNPGGQAAVFPISENEAEDIGLDRLVSPEELRIMGYRSLSQMDAVEKAEFREQLHRVTCVCEECNVKRSSGKK